MSTSPSRRTPLSEIVLLSIALSALATAACAQPCPTRTGTLAPEFFPVRMAASGDQLLVAAGEAGLAVLDARGTGAPSVLAMLDTPGLAVGVAVTGTTAVIADGSAGLRTFDISDPAHPAPLGALPLAAAEALAVDGRYAFVLSPGQGLAVVDLADPAHPVLAGTVPWEGTPTIASFSLHASGGLLFVTDVYTGLWIYGLDDPLQPALLSHTATPGMAFDAAPAGNRLAVVAGPNLLLYDIQSPASPVEQRRFVFPTDAYAVEIRGDYAFVANDYHGLRVVNLAGAPPFEAGASFTSQDAFALALDGDRLFVATNFLTAKGIDAFAVAGCGARIVPAAAHADGANGTRWRTDLVLTNPTNATATAALKLLPSIGEPPAADGPPMTVPAGASVRLENIVAAQWGPGTAAGAIAVEGAPELVIASRTYTDRNLAGGNTGGTMGQFVPSFPADETARAGEEVYLFPLPQGGSYRTNLGVVNISNQQYWVNVKLFDRYGFLKADDYHYLMPWRALQLNDVADALPGYETDAGYAVVSAAFDTVAPEGPLFFAYASVIDNRTGDPVFRPAVRRPAMEGPLFLPVFARAGGAYGASWRTELSLLNRSAEPGVNLTWFSSQGVFTTPTTIAAGTVAYEPDAVGEYFPPISGDARGTLYIVPFGGPELMAAARVYNDTPDGTYGQNVPPMALDDLLQDGETGLLTGLVRTAEYRTNAGFSAAGSHAAHLRVRLLDAEGALLSEKAFEVEPGSNKQFDDVFAALGVMGEVPLARFEALVEANGPVYAYASVVDNRSGDAVFIPAIKK
jgi:hypothetical protein